MDCILNEYSCKIIVVYSESFFDETTFLQLSNDEVITISWRFHDDLYDGLCRLFLTQEYSHREFYHKDWYIRYIIFQRACSCWTLQGTLFQRHNKKGVLLHILFVHLTYDYYIQWVSVWMNLLYNVVFGSWFGLVRLMSSVMTWRVFIWIFGVFGIFAIWATNESFCFLTSKFAVR